MNTFPRKRYLKVTYVRLERIEILRGGKGRRGSPKITAKGMQLLEGARARVDDSSRLNHR